MRRDFKAELVKKLKRKRSWLAKKGKRASYAGKFRNEKLDWGVNWTRKQS